MAPAADRKAADDTEEQAAAEADPFTDPTIPFLSRVEIVMPTRRRRRRRGSR